MYTLLSSGAAILPAIPGLAVLSFAVLTKPDGQNQKELETHSDISQVLKTYHANDQLRAQHLRYQ